MLHYRLLPAPIEPSVDESPQSGCVVDYVPPAFINQCRLMARLKDISSALDYNGLHLLELGISLTGCQGCKDPLEKPSGE
jgi:hypothetical protein